MTMHLYYMFRMIVDYTLFQHWFVLYQKKKTLVCTNEDVRCTCTLTSFQKYHYCIVLHEKVKIKIRIMPIF
jgi:hypothetical protein